MFCAHVERERDQCVELILIDRHVDQVVYGRDENRHVIYEFRVTFRLGPSRARVELAPIIVCMTPANGQYLDRIEISLEAVRDGPHAAFERLNQRSPFVSECLCSWGRSRWRGWRDGGSRRQRRLVKYCTRNMHVIRIGRAYREGPVRLRNDFNRNVVDPEIFGALFGLRLRRQSRELNNLRHGGTPLLDELR